MYNASSSVQRWLSSHACYVCVVLAAGLEESQQASVLEPVAETTELDDVIDDLLNRHSNPDPESQVMGEIIMDTGTGSKVLTFYSRGLS